MSSVCSYNIESFTASLNLPGSPSWCCIPPMTIYWFIWYWKRLSNGAAASEYVFCNVSGFRRQSLQSFPLSCSRRCIRHPLNCFLSLICRWELSAATSQRRWARGHLKVVVTPLSPRKSRPKSRDRWCLTHEPGPCPEDQLTQSLHFTAQCLNMSSWVLLPLAFQICKMRELLWSFFIIVLEFFLCKYTKR